MITFSKPFAIIYSSHAVSRYRERMNLDSNMSFIDVCKKMVINGCTRPRIVTDSLKIYGSKATCKETKFITTEGAFLGFYNEETEVFHADTFLSFNELREDQAYLNSSVSEDLRLWKSIREDYANGKISFDELQANSKSVTRVSIENGTMKELTTNEIKIQDDELKEFKEQNPDFIDKQIEANKKRFVNKMKQKGYK